MDWRRLEATREPATPVAASELRPSIRDFTQHLGAGRRTLSVIPLLARRDPLSAAALVLDDVASVAATLDELDVPALAVVTAPGPFEGRLEDLTATARAASAPVLRYDCVADENRLYESRLAGADAVLMPVAIAGAELPRLVALARAVHVVAVAEVATRGECEAALAAGAPVVALAPRCLALAADVPARTPLIAQEPITSGDELAALHGLADAVLVAAAFLVGDGRALVEAAAALSP